MSPDFNTIESHQYYGLLIRQRDLRIELARVECQLDIIIPHWANDMDLERGMGLAEADLWVALTKDAY